MANEAGKNERRLAINYWDGINAVVDKGIAKPQEILHSENARSKIIGTLEKREGQKVLGTDAQGSVFVARENYGLAFVASGFDMLNGLYRMSGSVEQNTPVVPVPDYIPFLMVSVNDSVTANENISPVHGPRNTWRFSNLVISESVTVAGLSSMTVSVFDNIATGDSGYPSIGGNVIYLQINDTTYLTEPYMLGVTDRGAHYIDNSVESDVNLYKLDNKERWMRLSHPDANNIGGSDFSTTVIDGKLFMVNGRDYNRYVDQDGKTVVTSRLNDTLSGLGSLYNTPRAALVNNYKSRIYLANYDWSGVHYGNSVLQSSTPLGIAALVQTDTLIPVNNENSLFPASELLAYYKFDETSGTAFDTTGAFNLTSGQSSSTTNGKINGALVLKEGTDRKFTFQDTGLGGVISIGGWFNLASARYGSLCEWGSLSTGTWGRISVSNPFAMPPAFLPPTGILSINSISMGTVNGSTRFEGSAPFTLNQWVHIIHTYNGTDSILYVNGVSTGNLQSSGYSPPSNNRLGIGGSVDASVSFDGRADEFGVWTRVLTSAEVTTLYNGGNGISAGGEWILPATDTTYIYSEATANEYEVWRINQKVADITVNRVDDLNIYLNLDSVDWDETLEKRTFISQDQIYVRNSFTGPKVYRFPNNPSLSGQNVKQYNNFRLSGGDESDITVMVNIGNVMLIANKNTMATWNDSVLNNFDLGIGIPSRRGYVKAHGAMYFIHYSGAYTTSGNMPTIISSPIQPYIDGATKAGIENAVSGVKGRSVFFCIGDVTLHKEDGSVKKVLSETCLEYNVLQQNWYVHTGVDADSFESFISEKDAQRLAFIDRGTKNVKTFLEGDLDDGKEIFFRADTQPLSIAANLEDLGNPETVVIESERGSSMELFASVDGDEYYQLNGRAVKGYSRIRFNTKDEGGGPPTGHNVSLSFRDSSKQRNKLGRVALTFVPVGTPNPDEIP